MHCTCISWPSNPTISSSVKFYDAWTRRFRSSKPGKCSVGMTTKVHTYAHVEQLQIDATFDMKLCPNMDD